MIYPHISSSKLKCALSIFTYSTSSEKGEASSENKPREKLHPQGLKQGSTEGNKTRKKVTWIPSAMCTKVKQKLLHMLSQAKRS